MNVKKLSPVAEFLRANHAKAKNHNAYCAKTGEFLKSCDFYDPDGNYLGRMSRRAGLFGKTPAYARLGSYIETMEPGFKAGYRQVKESIINFAKIFDKDGEKVSYLPEKIVKTQTVIDNKGIKTADVFERTISSNLKPIEKEKKNAYGLPPQNSYVALEPVKYKEVQTSHTVTSSDTF